MASCAFCDLREQSGVHQTDEQCSDRSVAMRYERPALLASVYLFKMHRRRSTAVLEELLGNLWQRISIVEGTDETKQQLSEFILSVS